jgi:hypothetical protein
MDAIAAYLGEVGKNILFPQIVDMSKKANAPLPTKDDVLWVITVPAIWTDRARLFMREASLKAGLVSDPDRFVSIF